jgi:hypothetical protein
MIKKRKKQLAVQQKEQDRPMSEAQQMATTFDSDDAQPTATFDTQDAQTRRTKEHPLRLACRTVVEHKIFHSFVELMIVLSGIGNLTFFSSVPVFFSVL